MKVYLQTLTPLHIGTGDVYQKVDYVTEKQRFYKIDAKDFENFISLFPNEKNALLEKYIEWIDAHVDALTDNRTAKDNLRLKFQSDQFKMNAFAAYIQKEKEYKKMIAEKESFQVYGNIRKNVRALAGSNHTSQYHIAGSSIKGAIRMALLHNVYMNNSLAYHSSFVTDLNKCLSKYIGSYGVDKKQFNSDLKTVVEKPLYCGYIDDKGKTRYDSEYYDICKFIQITDARLSTKGNNREAVQVWQTNRFNEKLIKDEFSHEKTYKIELQDSANPLVVWRSGLVWEFDIEIQLLEMLRIYQNLKKTESRKTWIGFEDKIKDFFEIDIAQLDKDLDEVFDAKVKKEKISEKQKHATKLLLKRIDTFYQAVLTFEQEWFAKERDGFNVEAEPYQAAFYKVYDYGWQGINLMRMAFAAGFPAHTELLMMLNDKITKEQMRKIMKALKIGNTRQGNVVNYTPNLEDFPKSRFLACNGTESLYPLGWVQLFTEENSVNLLSIEIEKAAIFEKNYHKSSFQKNEPTIKLSFKVEKEKPKEKQEKITLLPQIAKEITWENIIDNQTIFKAKVIDVAQKNVLLLIKDREIIAQLQMGSFKNAVQLQQDQIVSVMCKQRTKTGEIKQVSYIHA